MKKALSLLALGLVLMGGGAAIGDFAKADAMYRAVTVAGFLTTIAGLIATVVCIIAEL